MDDLDSKILRWAQGYNAYERFAGDGGFDLAIRPLMESYALDGRIPHWVGVDYLKAWAFYCARRYRFQSPAASFTEFSPEVLDIAARINELPGTVAGDRFLALPGHHEPVVDSVPPGIYTTEPMLTRALAAEIRNDPEAFFAGLQRHGIQKDVKPGNLPRVECEGVARLDVVVYLADGTTIGIEAKLDHEISQAQIDKQTDAVDELFLLVLEEADASDYASKVAGVLTWDEVIGYFKAPRLRTEDIHALPPQKVVIERAFRPIAEQLRVTFGSDWTVGVGRGGSGMPAITIWSPVLANGKQLRSQIQVAGRGMPEHLEDVRFEFHAGVGTSPNETDFPQADEVSVPPDWVKHIVTLRDEVICGDLDRYRIRKGRAGNGRRGVGKNKLGLVQKFLPNDASLALGYYDWAIGPKSRPVAQDELADLAGSAHELLSYWHAAIEASIEVDSH